MIRPVIRVLVVDDSAFARRVLREELGRHADIAVVGEAPDPYVAREQIVRLRPDVVTLDVEMPRMDGLSFLATLMRHLPTPVVVVSALAGRDGAVAERARALGAAAVVATPGSAAAPDGPVGAVVRAVRAAAGVRAGSRAGPTPPALLAVGASTGGTQAIERLLGALPADAPGTVIVQHMPEPFTGPFARRLDAGCAMHVREARDGDAVTPGLVLVAPGNRHLVVRRAGAGYGAGYVARVKDGPPVHHQRPAVDVLFQSVARHARGRAVGVLLTGMGVDGARGLLAMREAGAHTVAQDEDTCVVYGMPREAARLGAACEVLALDDVAPAVLAALAGAPAAA